MNERQIWTGIAPSPKVLAQLDYEEMATLALLSWSTAANRPVTSADVAELEDRDGNKLGLEEARDIVKNLGDMKVVSVYGMGNDRPMSVRVGGFQSRTPRRFTDDRRPSAPRAVTPAPRRAAPVRGPQQKKGTPPWVLKDRRVEAGLEITPRTPDYVLPESTLLRKAQVGIESGGFAGTLVEAAEARLAVLRGRIALYERWLKDEPRHATLSAVLAKKRKAVPELEFQVERARVKQAELETEVSGAQ
jgi:hypothetical protein